jgi:hypothetical protein
MSIARAEAPGVNTAVRRELLRLADAEDAIATDQAMRVPYWEPCPSSVAGHRAAAKALRASAERFLS